MIIIVETNFVYEVVMQQEEAAACEDIVRLARLHAFPLLIPAFSLAEKGMTAERRQGLRRKIVDFQLLTLENLEAIPLTAEGLQHATKDHAIGDIREWPDAVVFESVLAGVESRRTAGDRQPAVFVSRDRKAFTTEWALQQLRALDCRLIASFVDAFGVIRTAADQRP